MGLPLKPWAWPHRQLWRMKVTTEVSHPETRGCLFILPFSLAEGHPCREGVTWQSFLKWLPWIEGSSPRKGAATGCEQPTLIAAKEWEHWPGHNWVCCCVLEQSNGKGVMRTPVRPLLTWPLRCREMMKKERRDPLPPLHSMHTFPNLLAALARVPKAGVCTASSKLLRRGLALQGARVSCPWSHLTQSDSSMAEYMGTSSFNEKKSSANRNNWRRLNRAVKDSNFISEERWDSQVLQNVPLGLLWMIFYLWKHYCPRQWASFLTESLVPWIGICLLVKWVLNLWRIEAVCGIYKTALLSSS